MTRPSGKMPTRSSSRSTGPWLGWGQTATGLPTTKSWPDIAPGLADGKPVSIAAIPARALVEPTDPSLQEKKVQWDFDRHVPLDASLSAAELAYIALQTPVIMAVHASQLLNQEVS